jgi:ketosteroid isomerase-like protein
LLFGGKNSLFVNQETPIMKYLVIFVFLFSFFTVKAQDSREILAVLDAQQSAWNSGDLEKFMTGYQQSDSLLFVGKSGATYGWQQTLDNYKKNYPDKSAMGTLTFSIKKVQLLSKDTAFVLGGWHLQRAKDEPQGYFTLIFKKFKTGWKIISDHTS